MLRAVAASVRDYRRRVRRPFPFRRWAAGLAAALGAGLLLGLPSAVVPDAAEPAVGVELLVIAGWQATRSWRLARRRDRTRR